MPRTPAEMIAFMNEGFHKVLRDDTRAAVIIDREGIIHQVNPQFVTQFGYGTPEVVDQHVNMLLPEDRRDGHEAHIGSWFMHPRARPMGEALNIQGRNKNGELMDLDIQLSYVETDMGIMGLARITPR